MWSYYQYRKIARSVKLELENHADKDGKLNFAKTKRDDHYEEKRKKVDLEKGQVSEQTDDQSDQDDKTSNPKGSLEKKSDDSHDNRSEQTEVRKSSVENDNNHSAGLNVGEPKGSYDDVDIEKASTSDKKQKDAEISGDKSKGLTNDDNDDERFQVRTWGEDDTFDPKNWPLLERCKNIAILALLIFVQAWAGAGNSQANLIISKEFHVSQVAENLSTAMYLFGIGAGSLFVGPLSETFGRNPVYLGGTFVYMLFQLGCARVKNYGGQVVCRFFVGLFCSATLAINGGSVRDQFRSVKRSFVFPVIAWANVAAPVIAPIVGGWIISNPRLSWRWTEYVTLTISFFAFTVAFIFLPETHLPTLLSWKAAHLRKTTGDERYRPADEAESFASQLRSMITMPAKFWLKETVITVFGSYLVLLYVLLFSFLSGFDYIFKETYKLQPQYVGSCFGAIAAGSTTFTLLAPGFYGLARRKTEHIRKRPLSPEFRLWPAVVAGPLLPASLFWLGWTARSDISIWSGLTACFIFGGCLSAIYVSTYEYIIDSYGEWSSIALASITFVRYFISGGMVIAARPMYMNIGVKWSMTWLGVVALLLSPAPFAFWWVGGKLRNKSPYARGDDER